MKTLFHIVALLLLAAPLSAQTLDTDLELGSKFTGRIKNGADVDLLRFEAVALTEFSVTVSGTKDKLNKGNPVLFPQVEIFDLTSNESLVVETTGKKSVKIKKLLLESTGQYLIRIAGTEGRTGPYKLSTKGKLSKAGKKQKGSEMVGAGNSLEIVFDADTGWQISGTVKPDKKSLAQPGAPTLMGPSGPIDITAFTKSKATKFKHSFKKVVLADQGTYTLSIENGGGMAGAIKTTLKVKPVKLPKSKLVEAEEDSGVSIVRTLSGVVRNSNDGSGLPGVSIELGEMQMAMTDMDGRFIVHDPPAGDEVEVLIDGTSTSAMGDFRELHVLVDVSAVGQTIMMPIVLPDLSNPEAATDDVNVAAGMTSEPIDAFGISEDIKLSGPMNTTILIGGVPATGSVAFNVTPVDPADVPMPLVPQSGAVDAASFVTINPANGSFDNGNPGTDTGLNITLPNDRGFPIGTMVDIWSFDHDAGDWVNRSAQTGVQGVVSAAEGGSMIVANGVITNGGWHAPVIPVDTSCATKIIGRVVDTMSQPIPGAAVGTSTGQFATADGSGNFCIDSVTAYDASAQPACVLTGVDVTVLTPLAFGAVEVVTNVLVGAIVPAGVTDIGDVEVTVPMSGSLAGLLIDNGTPVEGTVSIAEVLSEGALDVDSNENGSFFIAALDAGDYVASFTFDGDLEPTLAPFTINANMLTTINLQRSTGAGGSNVTVLVVEREEDSAAAPDPVQGASVLLVGTDGGSSAGVAGTTNASGEVTFNNVDGPYTVTVQHDRVIDFGDGPITARFASTLVDIMPPTDTIGMILEIPVEDDSPTLNSTISGTITEIPALNPGDFLFVQAFGNEFQSFTNADTGTGAYSLDVPAGDDYVVVFNHATGVDQNENRVLSAQFATGVAVTAGNDVDVDFAVNNPNAILFDREIDVNYSGLVGNPNFQVLQVPMFIGNTDVNLATFVFDVGQVPDSVFVPSGVDAGLDGNRISLFFEQGVGFDDGLGCDVFLDGNPATASFDLPDLPEFTNPQHGDEISLAVAPMMTIEFDDAPGSNDNGVICVIIESESAQAGVTADAVIWEILMRAGTDSVQLPPTVLPMFGDSGKTEAEWEACIETEIFDGFVFDYDAFFNADIGDNELAVDAQADGFCEAYALIEFTID